MHMRLLISAMLIVVGVIHLLPLSGVLGSARLGALYGVPIDDPNLEILMRHRAVLFGLLGGYNAQLSTVFKADLIALACLVMGGLAWWRANASAQLV